ncbi:MAG: hypothetical protein ACRDDH_01300 [Cetobacterium sp.]|uniref:hypothetical protein n=1 Tax=Cetobacterium sp. TaxID=2071632 RepID=UPI003EE798F6
MKKTILVVMAILSATVLAASGDISISGSATGVGTIATKDIGLTGKAVKAVSLSSDIDSVDFGTVMIGKTASTSLDLILGGEKDFKVQLSADDIPNVVITGLENSVTIADSAATQNVPMTLAYTPTEAGEELNATLTVTAAYTD